MEKNKFDLHDLSSQLTARFGAITELYLFGSRKWKTDSPRSDLDILVCHSKHIRPDDLRVFCLTHCPALDLFLVTGGKAISVANESYVEAETTEELISRLAAVHFWSRDTGFLDADITWDFTVASGIDFPLTALTSGTPESFNWSKELSKLFEFVESQGLPFQPFIGLSAIDAADVLVNVLRRFVLESQNLNTKGKGITISFNNEYDLQNAFYIGVKPWIPNLAREEVTIKYDGQDKSADFNAFGSQVVIEMKHVRDANTKASVVKTLAGLSDFYQRHTNVRILIFFILVDAGVDLDDSRWESDYSYLANTPIVRTVILRNPK
jgi:hypothetical protein